MKSRHSVYTSWSAPGDLSVGQRCDGEVTETNALASGGTADTREADLSGGRGEEEVDRSQMQQVLIELILCAKHCANCLGVREAHSSAFGEFPAPRHKVY